MRGCLPAVFIDGVNTAANLGVDFSLSPEQVEAVEVYRGSEVPPQYSLNTCGSILIWTREPSAETGTRSFWQRMAVTGALVGLVALVVMVMK